MKPAGGTRAPARGASETGAAASRLDFEVGARRKLTVSYLPAAPWAPPLNASTEGAGGLHDRSHTTPSSRAFQLTSWRSNASRGAARASGKCVRNTMMASKPSNGGSGPRAGGPSWRNFATYWRISRSRSWQHFRRMRRLIPARIAVGTGSDQDRPLRNHGGAAPAAAAPIPSGVRNGPSRCRRRGGGHPRGRPASRRHTLPGCSTPVHSACGRLFPNLRRLTVLKWAWSGCVRAPGGHRAAALDGMRDSPIRTPSVAMASSMVSAAPRNTSPRSVSAKIPTGSVTHPGG